MLYTRHAGNGKNPPWLIAALSLALPGLGQIVCGQDNKGVFLVGVCLLGHWATGGISSWLLCPALSLDGWQIARKINQSGGVARWEFFPQVKWLNRLPPRILLLAIVLFIAAITVTRIVIYASDYGPKG